MSLSSLVVYNNQQPVGLLSKEGRNAHSFSYRDHYRDNSQATAVSLTMPVRNRSYDYEGLHPVFSQNLPEGYLKEVIAKTVSKIHGSDSLALLAVLGPYQMGRLHYQAEGQPPPDGDDTSESISDLLSGDNPGLFDELVEKYALRSGISGVQPKVLLTVSDKALVRSGKLIVKAWGDDYPQLAFNEYLSMQVAADAGLKVPVCDVSADGRLFLMERFDINPEGGYLGFEDGCTLQGYLPEQKYDSTYERLAKTVAAFVSPEHKRQAMEALFLSVLVSWAVRNGDAHLKNFGLLYDYPEGACWMSPTFDIVCTTCYLPNDVPALQLGGSKRWWSPKQLASFATVHCGLAPRDVSRMMQQVAQALRQGLVNIDTMIEQHPQFAEVGQAMQAQWRQSSSSLRAQP